MAALPGLQDELTCAVCLELFREPVTAPCGHNFCRGCLERFWAGDRRLLLGFTCPQCRAHFTERPELHLNRVLCAVVEGFERSQAQAQPPDPAQDQAQPQPPAVPCDSCPPGGALASRTCLTCLASFCPEHLEPHLQAAAFRSHSLGPPLADLAQRRCPQHGKLLQLYCRPHSTCICAVCLLQHRACDTDTIEEARGQREEELKAQQKNVGFHIIQLQHSLELVQYQKQHVTDSSVKQKSSVSCEFNDMKTMIEAEEQAAAKLIDEEESKASSKIMGVLDQISAQLQQLKEYKEQLNLVLSHTGGMVFWKNVAELPVISLDTLAPPKQIELDARKLELVGKAVSALKHNLVQKLKFSLEQRVQQLEQAEKARAKPKPSANQRQGSAPDHGESACHPHGAKEPSSAEDSESSQTTNPLESKQAKKKKARAKPKPSANQRQVSAPDHGESACHPHGAKEPSSAEDSESSQTTNPLESKQAKKKKVKPKPSANQQQGSTPDQGESPRKPHFTKAPRIRQDFMQYNCRVTFNQRTAHKKLALSERYTSLCVTEQLQAYPDLPERFFNCSQVLGLQWFTNGRRYWEVTNNGSSFWAIGIACIGMDRGGSRSRLGRNALSWCLESFGQKLSAWHGDREVILNAQQPQVIGVYLDFETGIVAFYSVGSSMLLLHSFKAQFQCHVFPAFWVGSSGTKLTLGQ